MTRFDAWHARAHGIKPFLGIGGVVKVEEGQELTHPLLNRSIQQAQKRVEAHNFQRDLDKFEALNAVVLGVSLDTVESHKAFCTKDSLTFKLLADPDHKVIDAYGVPIRAYGTMHFAERTTFLISPDGTVVKEWAVKDIPSHSAEVLAAIQAAVGNSGGH